MATLNSNNGEKKEGNLKYGERQLVVFNLGSEEFGVDINEVNSIIKMEPITKIPNSQFFIEGVINLRGKIIVVIHLAKKLGLPVKEYDKDTRIIIIETKDKQGKEMMVGMIVDHAREAIRLAEDQIEPAPPLITQKISSDYLEGVGIVNERLLILLDLAKVLGETDMGAVQMVQASAPVVAPKEEKAKEAPVPPTEPTPAPATPEPVAPVAPTEPTPAPATPEPVAPVAPTEPTPAPATLEPVAPIAPTEPTPTPSTPEPVAPVAPTEPTLTPATPEPVAPVAPTEPTPTPAAPEPVAPVPPTEPTPTPAAPEPSVSDIAAEVSAEERPSQFPDPVEKKRVKNNEDKKLDE